MNIRKQKSNQEVKPSLVSPVLATILSLLFPGLGHALARAFRRGLVLFASLVSLIGLLAWRMRVTARFEEGAVQIARSAFRLQPILLFVAIGLILIYLWIAYDAYKVAKGPKKTGSNLIWVLVLLAFFTLGWQIGEIKPATLISEAQDAAPFMMRVLWPWQRAIARDEIRNDAFAEIQVPCADPKPDLEGNQVLADQPYVLVSPDCGNLSEQEGQPGTTLTVSGGNFAPNTETEIWWRDDQGNEFRQRQAGEYVTVTTDSNGKFLIDLVMPYRNIPPSATRAYAIWQIQARQVAGYGPAYVSDELLLSIEKMIETIFLGMMSTFFGILLSVPISFLAARNLMSSSWITLAIYYLVRTILNIIRSIEPLIWAVIAIIVVGLGPFAGIVALTVHSIAALGKLYSEAIESIDSGQIEAIQATGANWLQTILYAVVPQIIPPFVSFTIYRWDINVRMSTVIGLVGGGGIGYLLIQWIHLLDYRAAGIAVWFIAVTVAVLDYVSAEIRARFV